MSDFGLIFAYISVSSVLIPIFNGLRHFKKLSRDLSYILIICVCSLLADGISVICLNYKIQFNNWVIANIFLYIQQIFLLNILLIYLHLKTRLYLLVFLSILFFINFFLVQNPWIFNSYFNYLGAILQIILCMTFLYRLLRDLPAVDISRYYPLWIAFASLTYYGGTLFLFLFNNYLLSINLVTHKSTWVLHNSLNILKNLLFAFSIWLHYRNMKLSR